MLIAGARILALLLLFAVCAPIHIATKLIRGRSLWPWRFLAASAWICGARIRPTGRMIGPHTLLVCNHTSWLDILVLGGLTGCIFVSKHELGHPFIHWMADQAHTLYVRRDHRRGAPDQAEAITRQLQEPRPIAIFPESTTGPGTYLLPFRSSLFAAVAPARPPVTVRPVAIDYGELAPELGWHNEPGKANVLRTLGRLRPIPVSVRFLEALPISEDRKEIAAAARETIEAALASVPLTARV
jgi:1-acyl-sn-glycerol-3-phosphate acyltransferase